jgi:hypothetical protein
VLSICNYLSSPGGTIFIDNNSTGCNSQQEVEDACIWVGIEDEELLESMAIFPNPCSSTLTIEFNEIAPNTHFSLINANGQKLEYHLLKEARSEFDISELPSGIYVARVWNDDEVMVRKIIKH